MEVTCSVGPSPVAVGQPLVLLAEGLPTDGSVRLFMIDPEGVQDIVSGLHIDADGNGNYDMIPDKRGEYIFVFISGEDELCRISAVLN